MTYDLAFCNNQLMNEIIASLVSLVPIKDLLVTPVEYPNLSISQNICIHLANTYVFPDLCVWRGAIRN